MQNYLLHSVFRKAVGKKMQNPGGILQLRSCCKSYNAQKHEIITAADSTNRCTQMPQSAAKWTSLLLKVRDKDKDFTNNSSLFVLFFPNR